MHKQDRRKRRVEAYFNTRRCKRCNERYRPGCAEIVSDFESKIVCRIVCTCCELPLGVALIGLGDRQPGSEISLT